MKLAPELSVTLPINADGSFGRLRIGASLFGADDTPEQKALGAVESVVVSEAEKAVDIQQIERNLGLKGE